MPHCAHGHCYARFAPCRTPAYCSARESHAMLSHGRKRTRCSVIARCHSNTGRIAQVLRPTDCERRAALKDANSRVAVCRSFNASALCAELRASSRLPAYSHAAWGGETQGLACSITMLYAPRLTPWRACDSSACRARAARLYTRGPVPKPAARPEARYEPELTRVPGRGVSSAHRLCQLTATPLQWPTAS